MVALLEAFTPDETDTVAEKRVGGFFLREGDRVGKNSCSTLIVVGKNDPWIYDECRAASSTQKGERKLHLWARNADNDPVGHSGYTLEDADGSLTSFHISDGDGDPFNVSPARVYTGNDDYIAITGPADQRPANYSMETFVIDKAQYDAAFKFGMDALNNGIDYNLLNMGGLNCSGFGVCGAWSAGVGQGYLPTSPANLREAIYWNGNRISYPNRGNIIFGGDPTSNQILQGPRFQKQ